LIIKDTTEDNMRTWTSEESNTKLDGRGSSVKIQKKNSKKKKKIQSGRTVLPSEDEKPDRVLNSKSSPEF
jgi:hypothetical protein